MSLVDRAKSIILQPGASLPAFAAEPATAGNLYQSYIMPLAAIPAIASFIGLSLVGVWIPLVGTFRYPFVGGVAHAIVHWVLALVAVFIFAMIVDALAPRFGAMRDPIGALKTVAVASTPGWVAGVFGILPPLAILQLLGALYGLYLLYLGLPIFMRAPRDRAGAYAIVSILVGIAISIVLAVVLGLAQRVLPGGPHSITADASGAAIGTAIAAKVLSNAAGGGSENDANANAVVANAVKAAAAAAAVGVASAAPAAPGESSAAGSDADTAKQAAAGAAAAGAMVGAMIGGGKKSVTTVDFQALKAVLPESAGDLKRTSAEGERTSTGGFSVSTAKGVYTDGHGGNVDVEIHDMANASGLLSMMGLATAVESESDTGYEKNEMIDGLKVHEKWTKADQSSELLAQVADRFMIEVRGNRVPIDTAKAALVGVDRAKLASLH